MGLTDLISTNSKSFELVHELINQSGGISGLIKTFEDRGLGGIAQSWIGTGQNSPLQPQQIIEVLGNERVTQLASKFGISSDQLQEMLSKALPIVIDKLSPNGQIPTGKFDLSSLVSIGRSIFSH